MPTIHFSEQLSEAHDATVLALDAIESDQPTPCDLMEARRYLQAALTLLKLRSAAVHPIRADGANLIEMQPDKQAGADEDR